MLRTVSCAFLIAIGGISTASAQSFAMDHGRAADAIASAINSAAEASARADAIRNRRPLTPSQATDFSVNGGRAIIKAAAPLTPEQQKAETDGRSAWQARCRPSVVEDSEGLRRTKYAETDCDLSRFNTAGAQ
jgi:4-hydroxyphenylpyruvate dioxygenase-like putative hemolysin